MSLRVFLSLVSYKDFVEVMVKVDGMDFEFIYF